MQRSLPILRSLYSHRSFSFLRSETVVASVLLERLPVVFPQIDPVVHAFREFSGKGDYQIDYVPTPRITEADKRNDRKSLQRALDRRLYLLLWGTPYGAPNKNPVWHFPEKVYKATHALYGCKESVLQSVLGELLLNAAYVVGNDPEAHPEKSPDNPSYKQLFFKSQIIVTSQHKIGTCQDHVWVTKNELMEYIPEQASFFDKMGIS